MERICPFRCEWNQYNGFILEILALEIGFDKWSFDGSLFGLSISKRFFIIDVLFFQFEIKSPIY